MNNHNASYPQAEPVVTVGIGASAGGLTALQALFSALGNRKTGMAFVIILSQPSEIKGNLVESLQPHASIPVSQVTHNTRIERDHIYVIPPNQKLEVVDDHLMASEFVTHSERRKPIDHFFKSLAAAKPGSIAIVLSGVGNDGAVGIQAIKDSGGIVIVQSPKEAEQDSMPRNAIATHFVDFVLSSKEIVDQLANYNDLRQRNFIPLGMDDTDNGIVQKILTRLQSQTRHDFSAYKRTTILRWIAQRMQAIASLPLPITLITCGATRPRVGL